MSKAAQQPLELKEACVRAAHEFIAEHGVEQLSLREVARRLGVSHQAPYRHYPSRDHLLAEVIRRCFRDFAEYLGADISSVAPRRGLETLGKRYLRYAGSHPLEYRLMFGTPWPEAAKQVGLVQDAVHAFDVLRHMLRRVHGDTAAMRKRVDQDAMFIWSAMHGLATITNSNVMPHLGLTAGVEAGVGRHVLSMIDAALDASAAPRR